MLSEGRGMSPGQSGQNVKAPANHDVFTPIPNREPHLLQG
jgi:hypothetical protein